MRKFVFMIMVFVLSVGTVDMAFGRADKSKVDIHYEEICVSKGETYWDIAKKYNADGMSRKEYSKYIMVPAQMMNEGNWKYGIRL